MSEEPVGLAVADMFRDPLFWVPGSVVIAAVFYLALRNTGRHNS
jgi:hypothetical protein